MGFGFEFLGLSFGFEFLGFISSFQAFRTKYPYKSGWLLSSAHFKKWVLGLSFWVSLFGFDFRWVWLSGFEFLGFRFRVSGLSFWVWGFRFGFEFLGLSFWVWVFGFEFWVWVFGFEVPGFGFGYDLFRFYWQTVTSDCLPIRTFSNLWANSHVWLFAHTHVLDWANSHVWLFAGRGHLLVLES